MGTYLSPGVYVEEVSGGVKPIAGVGTSTGAFVGIAEKGVIGKAVLVTNWSQFVKEFGGFIPNGYLAYGVYGFFAEGGTSCYVVRAASNAAESSKVTIKNAAVADVAEDLYVAENTVDTLTITARSEGAWGNRITAAISDPTEKPAATHFKLTVKYSEAFSEEYLGEEVEGEISEVFDNIAIAAIEEKVNGISKFINVDALSGKRPVNGSSFPLAGGVDGLEDPDYLGDADNKKGLHAFDEVDDINIVAIPDKAGDREVIIEALNYCKNRRDCFFIADPPYGLIPTKVREFKKATGDYSCGNAFNSSYGALYYPWVYISDPLTGKKKLVPPSGVVAGTYAYTDSARGVHKAPAGISEGYLDSVVGIENLITKGEHDMLNPEKINVIRSLPEGICIWGARTLSADSEWLYVNVRRLLLYIEESVDEGTQWVVFEPNDPALWGKVKRNLTAFLMRVWRDGALFGSTPEEAFFVKVDEENNPSEVRDAGQLIIEVGVAPVKPAEFVIIRISQKTSAKK
ncbi:MAG: phage tail sheath C-terminal domain-containing protein [bacterium]